MVLMMMIGTIMKIHYIDDLVGWDPAGYRWN